jgi:molybdate transport system substrate-binding protein
MARLSLSLLLLACSVTLWADPLLVAVASNFLVPGKELASRFQRSSGEELTLSSGSTGKLYAQIVNGAPFSVFLAANAAEPERLEAEGYAVTGSRFTYATGRLALWSSEPDLLKTKDGAELIRDGEFTRLAIANPRTAPYGAAAVQTMRALGLNPSQLGARLVRGENIAQTYQFVATGNVDLGFVAMSQVSSPQRTAGGSYWPVPAVLHDPIEQQAVLLSRAADDPRAKAFLAYLRSSEARRLIAAYGYALDQPAR